MQSTILHMAKMQPKLIADFKLYLNVCVSIQGGAVSKPHEKKYRAGLSLSFGPALVICEIFGKSNLSVL